MARLRIVFLSVSAVLISATLLSYFQVNRLTNTSSILTDASIPVFVRALDIEQNLTGLSLSLLAVESAGSRAELQPLETTLQKQLSTLKENIQALIERELMPDAVASMAHSLNVIETQMGQFLQLKRDISGLELALGGQEAVLRRRQASARKALERLASETSTQLERDTSLNTATPENFEQVNARHLRQANAVTGLTLEVEALIDSALRTSRNFAPKEIARIETEMRARSQGISSLLDQLRPSPAHQALADEILEIRQRIFSGNGILLQAAQLQAALKAFADLNLVERKAIAAISKSSDDLVIGARMRVQQATSLLNLTVERVVMILAAASLASMLVFCIANVLIVERQINQRMSRLTKAVAAIAANKIDHHVDIEGNDELAEMALALETFKATAEELRRSNTELEKFAYVAAHDLRSPLRAIQDITEWMIDDEENILSEESSENMILLQSRVDRLNLLLTDLLTYSRVGKESEDLTQLSLSALVHGTSEMLDTTDHFKISYSGTSEDIVTYATPLRQILLNLISNSIKHHDKESGEIRISGLVSDDRLFVTVEDDGPGIEPQYHDRIFGLFQTLRPRDEVEGSGLGLAIIWKLVEHYGGRISVVSNPETERGTRIEFDMPVKSGVFHTQNLAA